LQFLLIFLLASPALAQVELPELSRGEPIVVGAQAANQWRQGSYEVWLLRNCAIQQGKGYARSREAILWIDRADATEKRPSKVLAYLEGDVDVALDSQRGATRLTDKSWFGRFYSLGDVQVRTTMVAGKPDVLPPIYWRAMERRKPDSPDAQWRSRVQTAQYAAPAAPPASPTAPGGPSARPLAPVVLGAPTGPAAPPATYGPPGMAPALVPAAPCSARRIRVFPRSDVPVQAQWFPDPASNQWIAVIDSGVNVIVDGVGDLGTLDISTDRLVIWTTGVQEPDLTGRTAQDERVPLEFYMEGNIVFRQGERVIYAGQMYYDVPNHLGTVLAAEVLTPVRSYQGLLRLHSDVLQQTGKDRFFAQNSFLTSSRMGEPGYRLQAGDVYFEDIQQPMIDPFSGQPALDPATGQPLVEHQKLATAENNFVFIGPVPIFYWPKLATDLNDPAYYIRRARLRQDNVYGTQILTNWNGFELLGIRNKPVGTDLDVSLDYLGQRGFGYGAALSYNREGIFDMPGHVAGLADVWAIQDNSNDTLGQGRMNVPPEKTYRNRLFWQHRQLLPDDLQLTAELGWISDRNFLEEYYKGEWDELKDESTGVELKRITENRSWSLSANYRINDFFTETNWLPRADHFWIGQPLFNDAFTWYEHSSAGYAQFRQTTVPNNVTPFPGPLGPAGPFNYLPWEQYQTQGARLSTRQELDWPFQLGVVKLVPYALGEATYWGQDQTAGNLTRLFWQTGVRASMPMWSVDPTASNDLLNVHGLAHKVNLELEFSYAQANQNLQNLPLYDPLDDNSVELWRRMFITDTFGRPSMITVPPGTLPGKILIPPQFDERLYALRNGLQSWVASPSTEIAGDLTALRMGIEQKWQTKRGPEGNRHIIDWVTLDTNMTLFPNYDRDDFGQAAGLLDYNCSWHVGDRLTLLSSGIFDFFNQGQKIVTVGGYLTRPPRGSLYAGLQILQGPIDTKALSFSYSYWMSPKWVSSLGATIDLGSQGNIGESFTVTRVGESFLISAGFNVDAARNSVGVALAVEPRFLPKNRLGSVGGAQIPPAGAFGLE